MKNRKDKIQRDILYITISMFVIVALWLGFNFYNSYVTSTIDQTLQAQIIPIPGTFDTATIEKLKKRAVIKPSFDNPISTESGVQPTATPEVTPTQTPTASPAAEPSSAISPTPIVTAAPTLAQEEASQ